MMHVDEFNWRLYSVKPSIHPPQSRKEYLEDLRIKAANDKAAQETQKMIE